MKEEIEILFAALIICLFVWIVAQLAQNMMGGVLALIARVV